MAGYLLKNCLICDAKQWDALADLHIQDDTIVQIGLNLRAEGAVTYDMHQYRVLPGLIDAHVHLVTGPIMLNDNALHSWCRNGVTTVRDLGLGSSYTLAQYMSWKEKTQRDPSCATVITAGKFITAPNGCSHIMPDGTEVGIAVETPAEAALAVKLFHECGCDGVKTIIDDKEHIEAGMPQTPKLRVPEFAAITETASSLGMWVCAHVLKSKYLQTLLDGNIPELAHMPTDPISDEMLAKLAEADVAITPTICTTTWKEPEPISGLPPLKLDPERRAAAIDACARKQEIVLDNTRRFVQLGGVVALGTDTMRMESSKRPVGVPIDELRLLKTAGLSTQEVIAAATLHSAAVCGICDRVGTIEPGKQADLIAIPTPIEPDFECFTNIPFVMHQGALIRNDIRIK